MEHLQTCVDFFKECQSFKKKHRNFEIACEELGYDFDELNMKSLQKVIEHYVYVKNALSELCHLKLCKHEFDDEDSEDDTDDDMDVDTDEDTDNDMDVDTDEDNDMDTDDDTDMDVDIDGDDNILFKPEECCWDKILSPFNAALKQNKAAMVMLRNAEDKQESEYMRLENCFASNEKNLCAKLLQEICYNFDEEGRRYFKHCSSAHVKSLASYCKDKIKANMLEEMFGDNYKLLIDENVPLTKKRKLFKDDENIDKLINYLKENTLPAIDQFIKNNQMKHIEKYT